MGVHSLERRDMMLDIDKTVKLFTLIGNKQPTEDDRFHQLFIFLPGLGHNEIITFMIMSEVKWETIRAFQDLGKNNFRLLEAVLTPENLSQGHLCGWKESVDPLQKFLRYCDTHLAHQCLEKMASLLAHPSDLHPATT